MLASLRTLFTVSRPISWVNTAAPFVAGYLLSNGALNLALVLGTVFFLFPYNLAMYGINDIFDYESDRRNPRKNSVEGAVVPPAQHRLIWIGVVLTCIPLLAYLYTQGSLTSSLWLTFVMGMVVAYSLGGLRFKEIPFLDSFTSSTHFYGPLVYGVLLNGYEPGFLPAFIAFACWGMASHALGAIQDTTYDREAGIHSIATALGARRTAWFSLILYAAAALIPAIWYGGAYGILAGFALLPYLVLTVPCLRLTDQTAPKANHSWKQFLWVNQVAGFCFTLLYLTSLSMQSATLVAVEVTIVTLISAVILARRLRRATL